jgi:hypothetical protein
MTDKELVLKWYRILTETEMTVSDAVEFIEDCGTAERTEKIMKLIRLRYENLDI